MDSQELLDRAARAVRSVIKQNCQSNLDVELSCALADLREARMRTHGYSVDGVRKWLNRMNVGEPITLRLDSMQFTEGFVWMFVDGCGGWVVVRPGNSAHAYGDIDAVICGPDECPGIEKDSFGYVDLIDGRRMFLAEKGSYDSKYVVWSSSP